MEATYCAHQIDTCQLATVFRYFFVLVCGTRPIGYGTQPVRGDGSRSVGADQSVGFAQLPVATAIGTVPGSVFPVVSRVFFRVIEVSSSAHL